MFKVLVPARIDLGGGISDIPEFASTGGTLITNLAIDLFTDDEKTSKIEIALRFDKSNRIEILLNNQLIRSPINRVALTLIKELGITENFKVNIENKLPHSTGLGISSALNLALAAGFLKIKGRKKDLNLIKQAYRLEHEIMGVSGGFQDYISAYFGGLNRIDFPDLAKIREEKTLGIRLNPGVENYLNQNMIILVNRKNNQNSDQIVREEIQNFKKSPGMFKPYLEEIKNMNWQIYQLFQYGSGNFYERLGNLINKSWFLHKKFSKKIVTGRIQLLEEKLRPLVFGLRGPGSGANSLFLLVNPKYKEKLFKLIKPLEDEFLICYAKVNRSGLLIKS